MTREEAKAVFLNRGYVEVEGGTIYDADKWRESCRVISEWLEQEPTVTSTEDNAEMIYPQVEGITPTVVEPIPDVDKKIESYKKLLKHPVVKHIMDEEKEPCDVPDINDGDIISKQTVLDTISELNAISFYEAQEDSKECYYEIRQTIKDLPPVKPQESCDVPDINDGKMSEIPTGSKDVIWYSKRNYSEIVVEPQERSEE